MGKNGTLIAISRDNVRARARLNVIKEKTVGDNWEDRGIVDVDLPQEDGNVARVFDKKIIMAPGPGNFAEEKGFKASGSDNSGKIKIISASTEMVPRFSDLKVVYSIDKKLMEKIEDHKKKNVESKIANNDVELKIVIANDDSDIVYIEPKKPTAAGSYTWTWNGVRGKSAIPADKSYKVILVLTVGKVTLEKTGDIESLIKKDETKIVHKVESEFKIDDPKLREEWDKYNDKRKMQLFVDGGLYSTYVDLYGLYMEYAGVKEAGNPFEYIIQNRTTVNFLGKDVVVHEEFAKVLRKVNKKLEDENKTDYEEKIKGKYNVGDKIQGSVNMRLVRGSSDTISAHGFGMAIDLDPDKNSQIKDKSLLQFFIKRATKFDVGEKKLENNDIEKAYNKIRKAHDEFVSLYSTTYEGLKDKYLKIHNHHRDTNEKTVKLNGLKEADNDLLQLLKKYASSDADSKIDDIKSIIEEVNKLSKDKGILDCYIGTVVFTEKSKEAVDRLKERIKSLNSFEKVVQFWEPDVTNLYYSSDIDVVIKEIDDFISKAKLINRKYENLNTFGEDLSKQSKVLKNGFCDIDLRIVKAFTSDDRIEWGGAYNTQIDAMHFGFKTKVVKGIINKLRQKNHEENN